MAQEKGDHVAAGRSVPRGRRTSRGLDEIVERMQSEAKLRVARELHDSVAQLLTVMVVEMEHLKLDVAGQQALVAGIDQLQQSTREVLRSLRQVLYDLRDERATDAGFVAHLRSLLGGLEQRAGIRTRLHVSAGWPPSLSRPTVHNLCRIAEEALNDVGMHSGANRVDVQLETERDRLVLRVQDNGSPLPAGARRRQMGLIGMRERAILLGGRLDVTSGTDEGTTVRVVVPKQVSTMRR